MKVPSSVTAVIMYSLPYRAGKISAISCTVVTVSATSITVSDVSDFVMLRTAS